MTAVLAVLATLTASFVGLNTASAAPSLSTAQRAAVVTSAQRLGFDPATSQRIANDPQAVRLIPVDTKTVDAKDPQPQPSDWVGVPGCASVPSTLYMTNAFGSVIFSYTINKYWCWNMNVVTYAPPAGLSAYIAPWARYAWQYHGQIHGGQFGIAPVPGGFRGDQSWSQGWFSECFVRYGCVANVYPTVLVTGWFDGHRDTNAWK